MYNYTICTCLTGRGGTGEKARTAASHQFDGQDSGPSKNMIHMNIYTYVYICIYICMYIYVLIYVYVRTSICIGMHDLCHPVVASPTNENRLIFCRSVSDLGCVHM